MQSISRLNESYKNFFERESREDSEGSKKRDTGGNEFTDSWGWWSLVDALTNSRVDKWDEVTEWNVIKALNICCYYKDKQKMQERIHNQQMQKIKHGR